MEGKMRIENIHIKGFRNFDDEKITFQDKTLIIGANDVGKTNLIYALRLLFDKSISERDLELSDSDYNAYSKTDKIEITVTITNVVEECLLSAFAGAMKDGTVLIRYTNSKNGAYKLFVGFSENTLEEITTRQYIRRLNMQCVDTNRDLLSFLKRERAQILQLAKEKLSEDEIASDEKTSIEIQEKLDSINGQLNSMNYITSALDHVNQELDELSIHNEDQNVKFVAGESDADKLLKNLKLAYSSEDHILTLGGDGRNNQIFLATWIAKQNIQKDIDCVTFYAIEEPEAHLHPHQQRKLSEYIQNHFNDQVLITSHSPHIASRFDPKCIVRLYSKAKFTHSACGGCSTILQEVINEFSYRLNTLSAEVFFADGVFLVEGTSEVLFYNALAKALNIDLDRFNISILSVEGVGFEPYVAVCNALNIPWTLRTDNDIFSKPTKNPEKHYYAGISRIMKILKGLRSGTDNDLCNYWEKHKSENEWPCETEPDKTAKELNSYIRAQATPYGLYLSDIDLENDLVNSPLKIVLETHYGKEKVDILVKAMQTRKAENMMDFLTENYDKLSCLANDNIVLPLRNLISTVGERIHPKND